MVGTLVAALPGFVDLTDIQNPKTIAPWRMFIDVLAVAVYCARLSWITLRDPNTDLSADRARYFRRNSRRLLFTSNKTTNLKGNVANERKYTLLD